MATHLDLEEQEQLDSVKAFWKQYGNLVTWVLIIALGGFAAFNGWNWYQRDLASKASVLFDELERAAQAGDADKAGRVFADMKSRYASSAFAEQAGLLAARVQADKGQLDAAKPASSGSPPTPARTSTARSRRFAWPACCSTRRSSTPRSPRCRRSSPTCPRRCWRWPPTVVVTSCWRRAIAMRHGWRSNRRSMPWTPRWTTAT